jgi:hypothetical protein
MVWGCILHHLGSWGGLLWVSSQDYDLPGCLLETRLESAHGLIGKEILIAINPAKQEAIFWRW